MLHPPASVPRPGLPWPLAPWALLPWLASIGWGWWQTLASQLGQVSIGAGAGAARALAVGLAVALLARVAGFIAESGFYVLWWRARGSHIPFWRLSSWIAALSAADLLAMSLGRLAERHGGALPLVLAPLAGASLLRSQVPGLDAGLWVGFGSLGLLAAARVALTARAQAVALDRRIAAPLALTAGAWLASRVALWWIVDLARGMSPLG
ncbi:MAG: hypothetical protein A2W00_10160 [Candidatus Eisenbacteria bacterium RBG_16_71_46]|nr:MAG: hypothetical protein A2W00_10160 [Candidatus Eisenbacteria bacterium RBG_16_71_46]